MRSVAAFAQVQLKFLGTLEWACCVEAAKAANPRSAHYAEIVAEFVRLYGGGP